MLILKNISFPTFSIIEQYQSHRYTLIILSQKCQQQMSIYSGFATRQQQQAYDQSISTFLYILQKRIIKFFKSQPANDLKFIDILAKIYNNLKHMEQSKYLEPKLTCSVSQLMEFLKQKKIQLGGIADSNTKKKIGPINQTGEQKKKVEHKTFTNSKTSLQAISLKREKINVTERVAVKTTQKNSASQLRNTIIKKRKTTNFNHRSSIGNTISDCQALNTSVQQCNTTQKRKLNLEEQLNDWRWRDSKNRQKSQGKKQSKINLSSIKKPEKVETQEEVRQLIKGYLVKKKRGAAKQLQKTRNQIQQIFRVE